MAMEYETVDCLILDWVRLATTIFWAIFLCGRNRRWAPNPDCRIRLSLIYSIFNFLFNICFFLLIILYSYGFTILNPPSRLSSCFLYFFVPFSDCLSFFPGRDSNVGAIFICCFSPSISGFWALWTPPSRLFPGTPVLTLFFRDRAPNSPTEVLVHAAPGRGMLHQSAPEAQRQILSGTVFQPNNFRQNFSSGRGYPTSDTGGVGVLKRSCGIK